jgi:hypothetical protein
MLRSESSLPARESLCRCRTERAVERSINVVRAGFPAPVGVAETVASTTLEAVGAAERRCSLPSNFPALNHQVPLPPRKREANCKTSPHTRVKRPPPLDASENDRCRFRQGTMEFGPSAMVVFSERFESGALKAMYLGLTFAQCTKIVPESSVFNPFGLSLSERQIPRFIGNASS